MTLPTRLRGRQDRRHPESSAFSWVAQLPGPQATQAVWLLGVDGPTSGAQDGSCPVTATPLASRQRHLAVPGGGRHCLEMLRPDRPRLRSARPGRRLAPAERRGRTCPASRRPKHGAGPSTLTVLGTVSVRQAACRCRTALVVILDLTPPRRSASPIGRRRGQRSTSARARVPDSASAGPTRSGWSCPERAAGGAARPRRAERWSANVMAGLEIGFAAGRGAGRWWSACSWFTTPCRSASPSAGTTSASSGRVGATRGQVAGLFAGEAMLLGLIGSLLGLPLGWCWPGWPSGRWPA